MLSSSSLTMDYEIDEDNENVHLTMDYEEFMNILNRVDSRDRTPPGGARTNQEVDKVMREVEEKL